MPDAPASALPSPRRLFTGLATGEAITWTLLIVGMVLKYVTETTELGVRVFGLLHGVVFLAYVVTTVVVAVDQRWRPSEALLALAAAVPPFATLWYERRAERRGLLADRWRLQLEAGDSLLERLVAKGVARPVVAGSVLLVGVLAATAVLLVIGPPTPPGA